MFGNETYLNKMCLFFYVFIFLWMVQAFTSSAKPKTTKSWIILEKAHQLFQLIFNNALG